MISIKKILFTVNVLCLVILVSSRHTLKIMEGQDADIRDFPYMAALAFVYDDMEYQDLECGSTIINENTILSAAHCFYGVTNKDSITVEYGKTKFHEGFKTKISKIIVHENFVMGPPWRDDIAVVKVDPPIVFSETVQPVQLAEANMPNPGGKMATFLGWGETTEDINSNILQKVNMTIIDNATCEKIWKDTESPVDTDQKICAQADMSDGKRRGPCYGDSGGPLVIDGVQYGIISNFHHGCGVAEYPIIFSRVAHYIDWLSDKI